MFLAAGHQASLQLTNNAHGRNSQETAFRALKDSLRSRGDSLKLLQDIIRDPGWAVAESTGLAIATLVTIEVCLFDSLWMVLDWVGVWVLTCGFRL
jgi:hypothetical protein